MLLDRLQQEAVYEPGWRGYDLRGVLREVVDELRRNGLLARAAWRLYDELDRAPDFPVITVRWGFIRLRLTKERCEPALRWLLAKLVGPRPEGV